MKSKLTGAILAALGALVAVTPAYAGHDPAETVELDKVNVFRDLGETGDMLVFIEYDLTYAVVPSDVAADIAYLVQLKDSAGTVIGSNTPYPYNDNGYGLGAASIYLTAAEVTAAGLGAWPFASLTLDLNGNPTQFTGVAPTITWTLTSGDYSSGSGQDTNQAALAAVVLTHASILQASWGLDLLTDNARLNTAAGAPYYILAVPNLRLFAPTAFSVITAAPTFGTPVPTPGVAGTFAETSQDRFDAVSWLNPAFDSLGADFGLPSGALQGVLVLIGFVLLMILGAKVAGSGGVMMGFAIGVMAVIPVSMAMGFIAWAFGALALAMVALAAILKFQRDSL